MTTMSSGPASSYGSGAGRSCRTDLLAMVAHELNQPLTVIDASIQFLSRHEQIPADMSSTLLLETERLRRLVHDLIDIAQLTATGLRLERERSDLAAIVRAEVAAAQLSSGRHRIQLDLGQEVVPGLFDPDRIAQVLSNLLTNAIKYTPGGEITVDLRIADQEAWLRVRDGGPGIPADRLIAVFEPGVRLAASGTGAAPSGSGLGLYIVKSIVEAHGGHVWAEYEPGAGATFVVALPIIDPEPAILEAAEFDECLTPFK